MLAYMKKDWHGLWTLLAPDAQALWQGEQDFTTFEQNKFGALTLQSYTLDQPTVSTFRGSPSRSFMYQSRAGIGLNGIVSSQVVLKYRLIERITLEGQGTEFVLLKGRESCSPCQSA